jgi:dolichyl-phosphate beta-glucosyltransferase
MSPDHPALFDFYLVIPAFREELRLPPFLTELTKVLEAAPFSTAVQIVDDGSPKASQAALEEKIERGTFGQCQVLPPLYLEINQGKGGAIMAGWRQPVRSEWLGFVDADGAISPAEIKRIFQFILEKNDTSSAILASRLGGKDRKVEQGLKRRIAGRVFSLLARGLTGIRMEDSQCGFKMLSRNAYDGVAGLLVEKGFCFDVELLRALDYGGYSAKTVAIDWRHVDGGRLSLLRHGCAMAAALMRIRRRMQKLARERR